MSGKRRRSQYWRMSLSANYSSPTRRCGSQPYAAKPAWNLFPVLWLGHLHHSVTIRVGSAGDRSRPVLVAIAPGRREMAGKHYRRALLALPLIAMAGCASWFFFFDLAESDAQTTTQTAVAVP